jgi:hypothetical protein
VIDCAAGSETKRRHDVTFPLLTLHRGKDRVQDFSKKKTLSIPASCRFFIRITNEILRTFDARWYKFWLNPTKTSGLWLNPTKTSGLFWDMNYLNITLENR